MDAAPISSNHKNRIADAVRACLANGRRLLEDAELLEFAETPATPHFLSQIAQEEFAKAFLMALVVRGVIPWDARLLRAARDHACKQLLRVVMDYASPDTDEFVERALDRKARSLPAKVADALNILRHEKIGRWDNSHWVWAENPAYDREALAVAEGKQDRLKQDALYVRLAADGGLASVPDGFTLDSVRTEFKRATRLADLAEGVLDGSPSPGLDYWRVEEIVRVLFAPTPPPATNIANEDSTLGAASDQSR